MAILPPFAGSTDIRCSFKSLMTFLVLVEFSSDTNGSTSVAQQSDINDFMIFELCAMILSTLHEADREFLFVDAVSLLEERGHHGCVGIGN